MARDRHLLSGARKGPPRLGFHRWLPTVALGAYERPERAARLEYCDQSAIGVVRRLTGGSASYHDGDQLTWTLAFLTGGRTSLLEWNRRHAGAIAGTLRGLGIDAEFSAPGDLDVDGKTLGTLTSARFADTLVLQGTLLYQVDVETSLKALRMPTEKLSDEGILSARERYRTMADLGVRLPMERLADSLAVAFRGLCGDDLEWTDTPLEEAEQEHLRAAVSVQSADSAFVPVPGGSIQVDICEGLDTPADVLVSGSFQAAPHDLPERLRAALSGRPLSEMALHARRFLEANPPDLVGFDPGALVEAVSRAAERGLQRRRFSLSREEANTLMVHDPRSGRSAEEVLGRATVMLVPYCAKPVHCKWRHRDGCPECGECEVGDAYRLARERGMRVVTITRFEHLQETLTEMRSEGIEAYVGMCCGSFYTKRHRAFAEAEIPAVLLDIAGANCYELREEDVAYAGRFAAQAQLNAPVVEKVMRFVPPLSAVPLKKGNG